MTKKIKSNGKSDILEVKEFKPKTINQHTYVKAIIESDIVICTGPAGSGKTACSVGLACEHLAFGKIDKIVLTRPVIETGHHGLGYLPGDMHDKIHPYMIPLLDEIDLYLGATVRNNLIRLDKIEIAPLEYMRGRNFHGSFMILDEAQNASYNQLKMFLTRMGRDSTCIINGDLGQSDISNGSCDLKEVIDKLCGLDEVSIIQLGYEDIIRNSLISKILKKLED